MIRFFRKIRMHLLSANQLSKYTAYAIGEIVLVVIGILIALQINNWNEYRKSQEHEIQTLIGIKADINRVIDDLNAGIQETERLKTNNSRIIKEYESGPPFHDSIEWFLRHKTLGTWEPTFVKSNYENLKIEGMTLITNKQLRDEISLYFDLMLVNIEVKLNGRLYSLAQTFIYPMRAKHFYQDCNGDTCSKAAKNVNEVMQDAEFYSISTIYFAQQVMVIDRFKNVKQQSLDLLENIDQELASRGRK